MKDNTSSCSPNHNKSTTLMIEFEVLNIILLPSILVVIFVLLQALLHHYYRRLVVVHHESQQKLPPGPSPCWPLVGNLPELFLNKPRFQWVLGVMNKMDKDIACIRLGNVHIVPVKCPRIAREFLKKHDAVFASRPLTMATEYSSRGFLSVVDATWGDQWKKMRRVVATHVLSRDKLNWLQNKRMEEADNLVRHIYNQCTENGGGGAVVNVRSVAWQYSGNVIRKMMFNKRYFGEGKEDGGPGVEEERYVDAIFTILSLLNAFCVSDYMPCLRWFDIDGHEKLMKEAIAIVNMYHDPIIDQRILKWRNNTNKQQVPIVEEDLLDVLISLKNTLSQDEDVNGNYLLSSEEIKAQIADIIYASIDNPSNAAEWAVAEMLNQPHLLKRAVDEIERVVGKDNELVLVQESHLPHLNYIKACAKEAFRLHPIAPFNVPHVSTADSVVAGYFIPKGSHVLLSRTGLGRNPDVWDDPLTFNPDRHLKPCSLIPTNTSSCFDHVELTEPELRFISFSTGRRGCMGSQLGSLMTVMLLARLLQAFTWSVPPGELSIDLTESPNDLFLAKPLRAFAQPRLSQQLYTKI